MKKISRRQFTGALALGTAASVTSAPAILRAANPRVVVIGGGAGGATAARYLAKDSGGALDVTLIEGSKTYYTCFFSNIYLGGMRDYDSIGHSYEGLTNNHGVNVIHDWAVSVDGAAKTVRLASGASVEYDKLVVAPGIDIKYESIPGYSIEAQSRVPHAWKSGTQVQALKHQVENMKEGGTFIMVPPPNPYRCPPGPYERISVIAAIFKRQNPTAKIIVLDNKPKFSKQGLFMEGWEEHYSGMVEWIGSDTHGGIVNVNTETLEIETDFDTFQADAASVIPAQKAGAIASMAGVTDGDWAPITPATMQSKADENIYVVGDASVASAMPKSGYSANSQAKVAVAAIMADLLGKEAPPAAFANTCWSYISDNNGVKVGAAYAAGEEKIEVTSKFISATGEDDATRKKTFEESIGWYDSIIADMFS